MVVINQVFCRLESTIKHIYIIYKVTHIVQTYYNNMVAKVLFLNNNYFYEYSFNSKFCKIAFLKFSCLKVWCLISYNYYCPIKLLKIANNTFSTLMV